MFANPALMKNSPSMGAGLLMFSAGIQFITMIVRTLGMVYFVLLYYKFYADEWPNVADGQAAGLYQGPEPPPFPPAFFADPQSLSGLRHEDIYEPEPEAPEAQTGESAPSDAPESESAPESKPKHDLPDGFA